MFLLFVESLSGFAGYSQFVARTQGISGVYEVSEWMNYAQLCHFLHVSGTVSAHLSAECSFKADQIRDYIFGSPAITISGSRIAQRGANDILADYFGLPSDYQAIITSDPKIKNVALHLSSYFTLCSRERANRIDNLYLSIAAPLIYSRWDLDLKEEIIDEGKNFHPAGYIGKGTRRIERGSLAPDLITALKGKNVFGDMLDPLHYGKIDDSQSGTGIADVLVLIGWHTQFQKNRHASVFFRLGIPTGTRPSAEFLFEPQIGNNHHWEIGCGVSAYTQFWQSKNQESALALAFRASIAHLAATAQRRSFDLKNGVGSRYMLLEAMGTPVDSDIQIPAGNPLKVQYQGLLLPAIHATTLNCRISVGYQADISCVFRLTKSAFDVDIGYNFWTRDKEKLVERDCLTADRYALKGDASLYGFSPGGLRFIGLNATQQEATLFAGQGAGNGNFANSNADNAVINGGGLQQLTAADAAALSIAVASSRGSNPPSLLDDSALNESSALSLHARIQSFFIQGTYSPDLACGDRAVYGAIGLQINFASKNNGVFPVNSCWGAWLQGGISY